MQTTPFSILGIPGSLRRQSFNRGLLVAAQDVAPPGVEIKIFDLTHIPPYNADVEAEGDPPAVQSLKREIRASDALLVATPEYNYSFPGVLKNAIDWVSRPPRETALSRKAIGIMGTSTGAFGTVRSQLALRHVFLSTESFVLLKPEIYIPNAREKFTSDGRLTDEQVRGRIGTLVEALVSWARTFQVVSA